MSNEAAFHYNCSAQEYKEAQTIRDKYLPQKESALDELKRLDRAVENAGMIPSLVVGILSSLVFGHGMCFVLKASGNSMALSVFFGVLGAAGMIIAYPVYRYSFHKAKETYQPRILELAA